MAVSKVSGLAVGTTRAPVTTAAPTPSAMPGVGSIFQERYAAAIPASPSARPANGGSTKTAPGDSQARTLAAGTHSSSPMTANVKAPVPLREQRALQATSVPYARPRTLKKRSTARNRVRKQKAAQRSIAEELNISIDEICVGAGQDSVTFRAKAGYWQDTEFTLLRNDQGWTLDVSTYSAVVRERLTESEQALVRRFEDANLGQIDLRVRLVSVQFGKHR